PSSSGSTQGDLLLAPFSPELEVEIENGIKIKKVKQGRLSSSSSVYSHPFDRSCVKEKKNTKMNTGLLQKAVGGDDPGGDISSDAKPNVDKGKSASTLNKPSTTKRTTTKNVLQGLNLATYFDSFMDLLDFLRFYEIPFSLYELKCLYKVFQDDGFQKQKDWVTDFLQDIQDMEAMKEEDLHLLQRSVESYCHICQVQLKDSDRMIYPEEEWGALGVDTRESSSSAASSADETCVVAADEDGEDGKIGMMNIKTSKNIKSSSSSGLIW
ncbi:unnamed protein product, partial [Amoebophrya sp. A120]